MEIVLNVILLIVLIISIVPFFLSAQLSMSRSIKINASKNKVFSKLTSLEEYIQWNPFSEGDPSHKSTVNGNGVGSSLTWIGKKTGEGKMTIVDVKPEEQIEIRMEFFKPMKGEGRVRWKLLSISGTETEMIWEYNQNLPYFMRYFGLVMKSMMGKHFEKGLVNYKTLLENFK